MKSKAKSKVNEITRPFDLGNFTSLHYGKANLTLSAPLKVDEPARARNYIRICSPV
jgi:hypothetical protein